MNGADLARLELAKRAFRATEPSATEVQRGVRRARLALRRPKERRRWLGKGLVMVVLAVGGLAYAKPQAMGELLTSAFEHRRTPTKQLGEGGTAAPQPAALPSLATASVKQVGATATRNGAAVVVVAPPAVDEPSPARPAEAPRVPSQQEQARSVAAPSPAVSHAPRSTAGSQAASPVDAENEARSVSDWGRVGQALARGDEGKALAVLAELSESADQRTRDKADLGRAQLFMANGNRDGACALARALMNRRAGSRIERQAHALLKSCSR
jgi:hypothetical protein